MLLLWRVRIFLALYTRLGNRWEGPRPTTQHRVPIQFASFAFILCAGSARVDNLDTHALLPAFSPVASRSKAACFLCFDAQSKGYCIIGSRLPAVLPIQRFFTFWRYYPLLTFWKIKLPLPYISFNDQYTKVQISIKLPPKKHFTPFLGKLSIVKEPLGNDFTQTQSQFGGELGNF